MIKLKKAVGAGVLSLGVVVGLAGFAGATSGTIGTTGPSSENKITHESSTELDIDNDNDIKLSNNNDQYASSGDTKVYGNTSGGSTTSGDGANHNSMDAMIEVDNSQTAGALEGIGSGSTSGSASINNTGPDSENEVKYESRVVVDVDNDNNIHVYNTNNQVANSGDAEVTHNTSGGSATSGSVTNTSSSTFTVRVTN
jgi:hypothetical protein